MRLFPDFEVESVISKNDRTFMSQMLIVFIVINACFQWIDFTFERITFNQLAYLRAPIFGVLICSLIANLRNKRAHNYIPGILLFSASLLLLGMQFFVQNTDFYLLGWGMVVVGLGSTMNITPALYIITVLVNLGFFAYYAFSDIYSGNAYISIIFVASTSAAGVVANYFRFKLLQDLVMYRSELSSSQGHLEKVVEDKSLLLRSLGHDINNYLSIINAWGIKLERTGVKTDQHLLIDASRYIKNASHRIASMVDNLRRLNTMESGKQKLSLTAVDLLTCVQASCQVFEHKATEKGIDIECSIPDGTTVLAEENALITQVLNNLISNAIKFTPEGGAVLIFSRESDGHVELIVQDTGVGISDEKLDQVFNWKESKSDKGTDGESGTGHGLPLVKSFMDQFQGGITIESLKGESTGTQIKLVFKAVCELEEIA